MLGEGGSQGVGTIWDCSSASHRMWWPNCQRGGSPAFQSDVYELLGAMKMCVCQFCRCLHAYKDKSVQVSEHLVESNLQSVDSHGVIRLTQYTDQVFLISLEKAKVWQKLVLVSWGFRDIQVRRGLLVADGHPTQRKCILINITSTQWYHLFCSCGHSLS